MRSKLSAFLWHPLTRITDPGSVEYFVEGMEVPNAEFAKQLKQATAEGGDPPRGYRVNPVYLPAPHEVVRAFYTAFTTPPRLPNEPWLHESLGHSIRTIFFGFLISSIIGVPLGILCGTYRFFSRLQEPFIEFFRYLPAPAFGALCVAILGIDDGPKIAIIVIGTFFQQVLVISNTVRKVDPALVEAAQTLGARGLRLMGRVVIPASITDIYTDMRILLGWAWTYLIVAEVVGTMSGITFFINQQARYRNFDNVYAAIMMIGIIGLTTDMALAWLGKGLFPWKRKARARKSAATVSWWQSRIAGNPTGRGGTGPSPVLENFGKLEPPWHVTPAQLLCNPDSMLTSLELPDYHKQDPQVAARFKRIRERPVVLSVRNLQKAFGPTDHQHIVFDNVSLDIHRREFVSIIGPSGCGKSTFIRIVAGLDEATGGEMLLDGKPVTGPGPDRGMVFQGYTLFPWRTVKQNVMFGLEMQGRSSADAEGTAREWLEMVGLSRFEDSYPHELSGGMKQRVAIARALANAPRILIMDEPFGALDALTRAKMQAYLLQIWKKVDITILFITHDLDEAVYLSDRILVLGVNPGGIREFIENPVPRPRTPAAVSDAGIPGPESIGSTN